MGLSGLRLSRKGEFEDNERASKRPRVGSSASAGSKMNLDSTDITMESTPVPVARKPTTRAAATSTSTTSTRRSTRLQQGIAKPHIKVRRSRPRECILRLKLSGVAPTFNRGKPKSPAPLPILRTYN